MTLLACQSDSFWGQFVTVVAGCILAVIVILVLRPWRR